MDSIKGSEIFSCVGIGVMAIKFLRDLGVHKDDVVGHSILSELHLLDDQIALATTAVEEEMNVAALLETRVWIE